MIFTFFILVSTFAQRRVIQEKQIKAIESRMVDLESSVFLADSLYEDFLMKGSFEVQEESDPTLYQSGSSLLYNYYDKLYQKYPKKCPECKTSADLLMKQMEREIQEAGEVQYKKILVKADECFQQRNFSSAKEYYTRALKFRANDPYPKMKLEEIEQLLFDIFKQQQFNSYILSADSLFAAKDFEHTAPYDYHGSLRYARFQIPSGTLYVGYH